MMLKRVKGLKNDDPMEKLKRKSAKYVKKLLEEMRSEKHISIVKNKVVCNFYFIFY